MAITLFSTGRLTAHNQVSWNTQGVVEGINLNTQPHTERMER